MDGANVKEAIDVAELIALYIDVRDARAALKTKQKAHLKKYSDAMGRIEARLLHHLRSINSQSVSSDIGTAYITHRPSAPINDAVAFKGYVIENRAWDMLDWKANVTAVQDFVAEHNTLPPGVDLKSATSVGIQRK